jgi:hypothetical protein
MTDVTPETTRGLGRRALLRNGLIAGLGAAAATVAVPALAGVAEAAAVTDHAVPPGGIYAVSFQAQQNWWWCVMCAALFASDSSGSPKGTCPAGYSQHLSSITGSSSWEYEVPYNNAAHTNLQPNWNWCSWCQTLWYAGPNNNGADRCAANTINNKSGSHNPGTWNYDMLYGGWVAGGPFLQGSWAWCSKCGELFYNGATNTQFCPYYYEGDGSHTVGSNWKYQLFTPQTR